MHSVNVLVVKILFDLSLHTGVPVVLDGNVCPPWQLACEVRPAVAAVFLALKDDDVLRLGPGSLGDGGIEVLAPPLTALLPAAT